LKKNWISAFVLKDNNIIDDEQKYRH